MQKLVYAVALIFLANAFQSLAAQESLLLGTNTAAAQESLLPRHTLKALPLGVWNVVGYEYCLGKHLPDFRTFTR